MQAKSTNRLGLLPFSYIYIFLTQCVDGGPKLICTQETRCCENTPTFLYILLCTRSSFTVATGWGTADVEIKFFSAENLELSHNTCFKFGVGQNITLDASPTARNSAVLISVCPAHSAVVVSFNLLQT